MASTSVSKGTFQPVSFSTFIVMFKVIGSNRLTYLLCIQFNSYGKNVKTNK